MLFFLQRWPRLVFFGFGFLITALCGWVMVNWLEIAHGVLGMNVSYDTRPPWLRGVMLSIRWLPVGVLAILVVRRRLRGPLVRPVAFAAGTGSVYLLTVGSLILGPGVSNNSHQRA